MRRNIIILATAVAAIALMFFGAVWIIRLTQDIKPANYIPLNVSVGTDSGSVRETYQLPTPGLGAKTRLRFVAVTVDGNPEARAFLDYGDGRKYLALDPLVRVHEQVQITFFDSFDGAIRFAVDAIDGVGDIEIELISNGETFKGKTTDGYFLIVFPSTRLTGVVVAGERLPITPVYIPAQKQLQRGYMGVKPYTKPH